MPKKMLIDATHAEETRVVVVDGNKVEEFDFETVNKRQLAGNIYLAKVTRVEPSLQAAFVDYGGNRHGFLAFSEIHPDYYQIPVADREALIEEERAYAEQQAKDDEKRSKSRSRRRSRGRSSKAAANQDATRSEAVETSDIAGMDIHDVVDKTGSNDLIVGFETETPPAAPDDASAADVGADDTPVEGAEVSQAEHDVDQATDEVELKEWAEDQKAEAEEDAALSEDEESDDDQDHEDEPTKHEESTASGEIESVAQEDEQEEIRPRRKPRPRRYKIQEVIKVRQILLIQVVKEERGNKGAALTTYLSLAGRYCVLMPNTARGGGISRKITNAADRKKLKEIAGDFEVMEGAGLIIRTAGAKCTKAEIKRDYDYLLRQWEQVRDLTLKSIAPAPIYEEGSLIKRSIRDLYNREIDEVLIEGDAGYRVAKDYMKMLMPSHAKNVKQYNDPLPLFARFQVESYLSGMFNPTVQLKSGGYIVIDVTEALVAIDVNSGRATKEGSIEDTAVKTNLEAAAEVARQLRLRDLAGLIVIDFIDMEDRRNNSAVEKMIKDKLKSDRARIQVGRISGFGLMEMSRQRLRPGMIEATTAPCPHCHGTGLTRSDDNMALAILRELEEEGVRRRAREVLVIAPVAIANYMLNQKRDHIAMIESRYGLSVRVEASPSLISPDYTIERFKTQLRNVPEVAPEVVSIESTQIETPTEEQPDVDATTEDAPKKKRRRRRRRGGRSKSNEDQSNASQGADENADAPVAEAAAETETEEKPAPEATATDAASSEKPKPRKRTTKRAVKKAEAADDAAESTPDSTAENDVPPETAEKPAKAKPRRRSKKTEAPTSDAPAEQAVAPETATRDAVVSAPKEEASKPEEPAQSSQQAPKEHPVLETAETEAPAAPAAPAKPKRRGWWSRK